MFTRKRILTILLGSTLILTACNSDNPQENTEHLEVDKTKTCGKYTNYNLLMIDEIRKSTETFDNHLRYGDYESDIEKYKTKLDTALENIAVNTEMDKDIQYLYKTWKGKMDKVFEALNQYKETDNCGYYEDAIKYIDDAEFYSVHLFMTSENACQ